MKMDLMNKTKTNKDNYDGDNDDDTDANADDGDNDYSNTNTITIMMFHCPVFSLDMSICSLHNNKLIQIAHICTGKNKNN